MYLSEWNGGCHTFRAVSWKGDNFIYHFIMRLFANGSFGKRMCREILYGLFRIEETGMRKETWDVLIEFKDFTFMNM